LACGDGNCVERGLFCNGEKDCADGSDENTCGTYWDMFQYFFKCMLKYYTRITKDTKQSYRSIHYKHKYVPTARIFSQGENINVWRREDARMSLSTQSVLHRTYRLHHIQMSNNFRDAVQVTNTK
jgi:hypothetical protein